MVAPSGSLRSDEAQGLGEEKLCRALMEGRKTRSFCKAKYRIE